ncbi:MAG: DUF222 domain-containing protein [Sporichthyaceae bacterium]
MSSTDDRGSGDDAGAPAGTRAGVALRRDRLRATVGRIAAVQAEQLRLVAGLVQECAAAARRELAGVPPGWGVASVEELTHSAVIHEVMVILAIAKWEAEKLVERATRLVQVLPDTLAAVEAGRIDLKRAEVLAEETAVLDDGLARQVEALVLHQIADNDGPWQGLSPRRWRSQIQRAVVEADIDAARRRREAVILLRAVRAWAQADGSGVLQVIGQDADIAVIDAVITDLALAWPAVDADGNPLSMDQRRFDALMDLFRRVAEGADLPWVRVRRDREIGLVMHADAFFGDGPGKDAPGELRGLGQPAPVDPVSAAEMARAQIEAGAPTRVLLVDGDGVVQRTIRLPEAPPGGWTRDLLVGSVRKALPDLPSLLTESYQPTVAITEHVRAVHPRCTSYDCARLASRCDLDHDQAYPRGPTCVTNLCPRCRRHHELKTRGLVHTRLHPDGSVTTTTLLGTTLTTRPERQPGHGLGEAYAAVTPQAAVNGRATDSGERWDDRKR